MIPFCRCSTSIFVSVTVSACSPTRVRVIHIVVAQVSCTPALNMFSYLIFSELHGVENAVILHHSCTGSCTVRTPSMRYVATMEKSVQSGHYRIFRLRTMVCKPVVRRSVTSGNQGYDTSRGVQDPVQEECSISLLCCTACDSDIQCVMYV